MFSERLRQHLSMVGTVEGTLTLSVEDLDRGEADKPGQRWRGLIWMTFGSLLLLAHGLPLASALGKMGPGELWHSHARQIVGTLSGLTLFVLGLLLTRVKLGKYQLARLDETERNVTYRFDAEGAHINTPSQQITLRYSALNHYVDGKHSILLYPAGQSVQVVPKRAFSSEELEQIRAWLAARARLSLATKLARPRWIVLSLVVAAVAGFFAAVLMRR